MGSSRITQKEIARRLDLTQASVSLALGNHPSIPEKTRALVRLTAENLGYAPDPYLSGLSAYRKRVRPTHFQGTLAWLTNFRDSGGWRRRYTFRGYYEGAVRRAGELGYRVEEHHLQAKSTNSPRVEGILMARNIIGLLLPPQPEPNLQVDFPFQRFSAITFGYTLAKPQLHLATLHQFRSMETAFRKLLALGYRRPGLALADDSDRRADCNWSAAFWSEQRHLPKGDRIPLLLPKILDRASFAKWFKKHRPDVVLSIWPEIYDWLVESGEAVPETTGFALLSVPEEGGKFSGIWENPEIIGTKAVEFLIDMIHRGECGVPEVPLCILVKGTWESGQTVRTPKGAPL